MQRLTFSMITDMFTIGLALGIMLFIATSAQV
jgi:hypothetical protein